MKYTCAVCWAPITLEQKEKNDFLCTKCYKVLVKDKKLVKYEDLTKPAEGDKIKS